MQGHVSSRVGSWDPGECQAAAPAGRARALRLGCGPTLASGAPDREAECRHSGLPTPTCVHGSASLFMTCINHPSSW